MNWKPLYAPWKSLIPTHADAETLPAKLATPDKSWAYGAVTDLVETDKPATIRIKAKGLSGKVGFCLISEDYSNLASNQVLVTAQDKDATIELKFEPEKSPARLLVRNYNDNGKTGEVEIASVEISVAD